MKPNRYSRWSLVLLSLFIISLFFYFGLWKKNRVVVDAPSYYTYLPALFIHGDLHLNYIKDPGQYGDKVWFYRIEDGQRLIKHPMGVSVLLSPFFLFGHLTAKLTNSVQDGYSMPYQNWISIGVLFYLFAGLYFLRKLLLEWFTDAITALTLLAVVIGTNLLWYSTQEGFMPHAVTFSMWCMAIYSFFRWLKHGEKKYILFFGIAFGFIVLIRPLSIAGILFFLIYGMISKGGIGSFLELLKTHWRNVLISALIAGCIAALQLCYWKYATGHWLYDVYKDEHFLFDSPQMIAFLFSFRKGVFIYTPVLVFAVIGLVVFFRENKAMFWSVFLFMFLTIYLLSSWWAWSYGICWGMRPMIDYYSLLAFPIAAGIRFFFEKSKIMKAVAVSVLTLLIALNLFQTWQYKNGLIHYDDMSRKAYFHDFFRTKYSTEWADLLEPFDWERRIAGQQQIRYSSELFVNMGNTTAFYLRGMNLLYIGVNEKAQNAMAALAKEKGENGKFFVQFIDEDWVAIRAANGLYWSCRPEFQDVVTASSPVIGKTEYFTIEYLERDDNRFAIKAPNGKYVSVGSEWPFILQAKADTIGRNEIFRYFVK